MFRIIPRDSDTRLLYLTCSIILCNLVYNFFPVPPVLWRLLLVVLGIYVINKDKCVNQVQRGALIFVGLNVVYFLFTTILYGSRGSAHLTALGNTLSAFSTLFIFSYLEKKKVITDRFLLYFSILLILCSIEYYFYYQQQLFIRLANGDDMDIQVNASTVFVMLIPLLFLLKNKIVASAELLICLFFIVTAVKRGNIVAASLPVLLLLYYYKSSSRRRFLTYIIIIVSVVITFNYFKENVMDDFFYHRLEATMDGDSSERGTIYARAFSAWENSNMFAMIMGNGYDMTKRLIGIKAHCDWLEILVNYGLVGVGCYLYLFISLAKQMIRANSKRIKYAMVSCFFIWGVKSVISMAFIETWMMILMAALGICLFRDDDLDYHY